MLMHRRTLPLGLAIGVGLVVAAATLSRGGPVDPPAGPVAPTMHTLDEIHDAVTGLTPSAGGCGPGVPGEVRRGGTMTLTGIPGTLQVLEVSQEAFVPVDANGIPTGAPRVTALVVTKNTDAASPLLLQRVIQSSVIPAVDVILNDAAGPYYRISLANARIIRVAPDIQTVCDGAAHTETITISFNSITWSHLASGHTFSYP